ncbi:nucleotide-binding universal stress UspA family protein [Kitasatospora sp. SolWspMP-SS2h]|uniref:universal stress protein n=1 Tax=Kitasatospora sp. SolWspMP-SS2h TaxID=1305729 RepID=UPI000DB915DF|nr:universal stress protein [Kitasatospora sp. SolWspMP-SS2h]RAJ42270.1 nucleotide-binding universal stress UspA family protein [Kitasatospora sp. SolWspMP-SS2h]
MAQWREPRVVVGVDGSPGSLAALRRAVPEAAARGAVLVPLLAGRPPDDAAARRLLDAALRQAAGGWPDGVVVRPVVASGPAGAALVAEVGGPGDLLLLGADGRHHRPHRRHGLPHLRGTRTAHHCRAHAPCPVLTVPADRPSAPTPLPAPPRSGAPGPGPDPGRRAVVRAA